MSTYKTDPVLGEVRKIPVARVLPLEGQPRKTFNQRKLEELASSIKKIGQQVPGIVRAIGNDLYELIDGERRLRACRIAGVEFFIAYVTTNEKPYVASVVANLGREDYTILEAVEIVKNLKAEGYTIAEIAETCSRSSTWVHQNLNILKLHPDVRKMLDTELPEHKQLNFSTALSLLESPYEHQAMLAKSIVDLGLNTNRARDLIQTSRIRSGNAAMNARPDRDFKSLVGMFERAEESFDLLVKKPKDVLKELLRFGKREEKEKILEKIKKMKKNLQKIDETFSALIN